ncbi:unnamed protein product [Allacma fusca]|uniref:Uncharacterized protein n=1 Tax=Allacma fusca TaxID=39272 RepID=A0A8J2P4U9_9HEXA|nr:unnamed protein product [Allacma fusca]
MRIFSSALLFLVVISLEESLASIIFPAEGAGENLNTRFRRKSCVSNDGPCPTEKGAQCCNVCSKLTHQCKKDITKRIIDQINTHGMRLLHKLDPRLAIQHLHG